MKKSMKIILVLALPAMMENVFQFLLGFTDTYFISRLGTNAVAGVGAVNSFMNIYLAFFLALSVGTTALLSQYFGAKEKEKSDETLRHSLYLAGSLGLLVGLINILFAPKILSWIKLDEATIGLILPYFYTVAVPALLISITYVLSSALKSIGNTVTPMKVGILVTLLNIVLNYILIFGVFGFEGFGIVGAGIATTISRLVGLLLLLYPFFRKNAKKEKWLTLSLKGPFNPKAMKSLTKISIPAAIERLLMRVGQVIYVGMIIQIGIKVYAAHSITGSIEMFSYLPAMGFGVAAATLVGQNLGKGDIQEAKRSGWISYGLASLFMMVAGAIFYIGAPTFARMFSEDPEVISNVVKALRIIALVQPFLASTFVTTSALQGAGDTKFPMIATLIGIWAARVLGIYVLGVVLDMGIVGVWLSIAIDLVIRGSLLLVRFGRGKWIRYAVVQQEEESVVQ